MSEQEKLKKRLKRKIGHKVKLILKELFKKKENERLKIKERKPLMEKQKARIYNRIGMAMMYNDPLIEEVIERDFGGNEELYLRTMAWPEDLEDD